MAQHGIVLDVQEDGSALAADRIGERPKVLHCPATGKYVMYIHAETPDYGYAHIGVAVADAPTGPFAFQTTITWRGYLSRDIGVFQDEDGSGYIMSEDRDHGTHIYRLADDYLTIVEDVACERATDYPYGLESPTIIKKDGLYYWFGSQLTSWTPTTTSTPPPPTCTARGGELEAVRAEGCKDLRFAGRYRGAAGRRPVQQRALPVHRRPLAGA